MFCNSTPRVELDIWITNVERILTNSQQSCVWFMDMMGSAKGTGYLKFVILSPYLVFVMRFLAQAIPSRLHKQGGQVWLLQDHVLCCEELLHAPRETCECKVACSS